MPSGLLWRAYGILPFSTQFNSFALIWPLFSMRMGLVQNLIFGANTFWALFKINDIPQYPFIRKRDQPSPVGFLKNHPISDSQCFLIFQVWPVTISWLFLEFRIVICHILHQTFVCSFSHELALYAVLCPIFLERFYFIRNRDQHHHWGFLKIPQFPIVSVS